MASLPNSNDNGEDHTLLICEESPPFKKEQLDAPKILTRLQWLVSVDNAESVEREVKENGIDFDAPENENILLLAASQRAWNSLNKLILLNAKISVTDSKGRNILHKVVLGGGPVGAVLHTIINEMKTSCSDLLNKADNEGNSPLHLACEKGYIRSVIDLIKFNAFICPKNKMQETPIHIAARYGWFNIVKVLLDSSEIYDIIVASPSNMNHLSPLELAAKNGHHRIVGLFLTIINITTNKELGIKAFHLAAKSGHINIIDLLLSVDSKLLDEVDCDKNTALHLAAIENKPELINYLLTENCELKLNGRKWSALDYAIKYNYPDAVLAMVKHESRSKDVMAAPMGAYSCVTFALIESMPNVFKEVLEGCITKIKDSDNLSVKYSFEYLKTQQQLDNSTQKTQQNTVPLPVLNKMVEYDREELLAHPVCQKYLQMKWKSYGKKYYILNLLLYFMFLIWVTMFALMMINNIILTEETNSELLCLQEVNSTTSNATNDNTRVIEVVQRTAGIIIGVIPLLAKILYFFFNEIRSIYITDYYFRITKMRITFWILHAATFIMVIPVFFNDGRITNVHYTAASIAVFLAWFIFLLDLNKFAEMGIYIEMFRKVLKTSLKVMTTFSILIIAFGLAFFILLSSKRKPAENHLSFSNIPMSLFRTFSMMMGELDFADTYVNTFFNDQLKVPLTSFLFLCVFMILMPILLMNLFIGLAVGDIESVRREAHLMRLAVIVNMHTMIEKRNLRNLGETTFLDEIIESPNESYKCKPSFIKSIFKKWMRLVFDENTQHDTPTPVSDDNERRYVIMNEKLEKMRYDMWRDFNRQLELLRLIVAKLDIETECDWDFSND